MNLIISELYFTIGDEYSKSELLLPIIDYLLSKYILNSNKITRGILQVMSHGFSNDKQECITRRSEKQYLGSLEKSIEDFFKREKKYQKYRKVISEKFSDEYFKNHCKFSNVKFSEFDTKKDIFIEKHMEEFSKKNTSEYEGTYQKIKKAKIWIMSKEDIFESIRDEYYIEPTQHYLGVDSNNNNNNNKHYADLYEVHCDEFYDKISPYMYSLIISFLEEGEEFILEQQLIILIKDFFINCIENYVENGIFMDVFEKYYEINIFGENKANSF